ncbi:recombinase [Bacillus phage 049ML001]|uniref:Recombinase n=1 Tax=Bacillus phage 049ML001 TaxID=2601660 RepID=A0A5P8PHZ5_9CAUD|nr:recombinase [Bacillus phage 049ML001]QFR56352.1 recombinase [Bacillus phage 049ML001]QFR56432.1 recombinase [Bacillus phage 049ML003]
MATKKQEELKNTLAQQNGAVPQTPVKPQDKVKGYLERMMPAIKDVLPKHLDADRLSRIAMNVIRTNPKLLECDTASLMGAVLESAKLGVEPGLLGQAYILPYTNYKKKTVEAQFILGYKGLLDLVRRSGHVSTISAQTVYKNDTFEYEYGLDDKLIHRPAPFGTDRGEPVGYYAVAKMKDGGYNFLVMSKQDVEKHRDAFSKSKNREGVVYGPWADHFDAMAKKTVLRQLINYLPISVEQLSGVAADERTGSELHNQFADDDNIINVDINTGEIIDHQEKLGGETNE